MHAHTAINQSTEWFKQTDSEKTDATEDIDHESWLVMPWIDFSVEEHTNYQMFGMNLKSRQKQMNQFLCRKHMQKYQNWWHEIKDKTEIYIHGSIMEEHTNTKVLAWI